MHVQEKDLSKKKNTWKVLWFNSSRILMMVRMDTAVVMYVMALSIATQVWGQESGEKCRDPEQMEA